MMTIRVVQPLVLMVMVKGMFSWVALRKGSSWPKCLNVLKKINQRKRQRATTTSWAKIGDRKAHYHQTHEIISVWVGGRLLSLLRLTVVFFLPPNAQFWLPHSYLSTPDLGHWMRWWWSLYCPVRLYIFSEGWYTQVRRDNNKGRRNHDIVILIYNANLYETAPHNLDGELSGLRSILAKLTPLFQLPDHTLFGKPTVYSRTKVWQSYHYC